MNNTVLNYDVILSQLVNHSPLSDAIAVAAIKALEPVAMVCQTTLPL